ncbi:hypothetical protein MUK42_27621 [Musa troglodytarum]|uniref:EIF3F/CSN6-like C-terminal domain-containing protein n=1 Tax=Musa troglodytarum TaxID=320322 RepID=A0A9E7F7U9_9LILI|nr:hypothetical protein MUK42_27621 [Musa troglodytarum]
MKFTGFMTTPDEFNFSTSKNDPTIVSTPSWSSINLKVSAVDFGLKYLLAETNDNDLSFKMSMSCKLTALLFDLTADILKTVNDKLPNDLEGMEASTKRLYALIDDIYKYVDDVVEGRAAPDNDIGRFLANALASVLKISATDFDNVFNERIQDNFALIYLSSLIRTQLSIAEKLNTAAQILVLDNNRPDIFNLKVG